MAGFELFESVFRTPPGEKSLEIVHIKKREVTTPPEGVVVFEKPKLVGDGEDATVKARYGLIHIVKIEEDAEAEKARKELYDVEFNPGYYGARIDFDATQEKNRAVIINTAGLIAKEVVLRIALINDYQRQHESFFTALKKYHAISKDRQGDELADANSYLKIKLNPLDISASINKFEEALKETQAELGKIMGEVYDLLDDCERLGIIQVWDSAMPHVAIKDLRVDQKKMSRKKAETYF